VTWPVLSRGVELTHSVPVLGHLLSVDGLIGASDQRCKRTVVAVGIDPGDTLVLDSADARAKAQAQHAESGEVDLGIAVGVGVMLFDLELALVVANRPVQRRHRGRYTQPGGSGSAREIGSVFIICIADSGMGKRFANWNARTRSGLDCTSMLHWFERAWQNLV